MAFNDTKFKELLNARLNTSTGGFNETKFKEQLNFKLGNTAFPTRKKTETSDGLYNLAVQNGLQRQADRILASQQGEQTKKIFSGGFISDVFDVLSAAQYGVTGVLKGKSFAEGVRTRQSFSDKDALGDKGLPGVIGGILLDIAVDPLTYIAPYTIVKKIPLLDKALKAGKAAVFGKKVEKIIDFGDETISKLDPLINEAKKYKSAEEFVKAQPKLYHGGSADIKDIQLGKSNFQKTFYMSENPDYAKSFGGNKSSLNEIMVDSKAKLADLRKPSDDLVKQIEDIISSKPTGKTVRIQKPDGTFLEMPETKGGLSNPVHSSKDILNGIRQGKAYFAEMPEVKNALKKLGYDGMITQESKMGANFGVWNKDILKTKSQLEEIWNVAKAGAPKTYQALEGGTKVGKYLGQKFAWMFGADPIFRETFERGLKNTAISTQGVVDLVKPISKLEPTTASKLLKRDETGRFIRVGLDELQKVLTPEELQNVSAIYNRIDDLGKQAVDLGLLSEATRKANEGEYLKNAYLEYEQAKNKGIFGFAKTGIKGIKKRVGELSPEKMKELGQIDNPAYLLFKSGVDLARDVENAKMLRTIGEKFGTDIAQEGFELIPKTTKWGQLGGKYIPSHMKEYLTEMIEPAKDTFGKQLVGNFKFFKVVMNPATHARNIVSNKILNYWKLGMNPLDPKVISADATAIKEIAKGSGKWIDEAKPLGYNLDTFASAEMKSLLDSPEVSKWGKGVQGWEKIKTKLGNIYQQEENYAKLSAYIFQRGKGLSPEDAWKAAESATFNYAQVTPFVRKLRESLFGFPFITFTVKSTPLALETIAKNPQRISVLAKIKQGIESQSDIKETDKERASEPEWVKNGFYVKLPMKDKDGRSAYLDLTYILPFGDLVSGSFFERGTSRETGLQEGSAQALLRKSPATNLISELAKNADFYGNSIWKESDPQEKQLADIMRHITKTFAPPTIADQLPGGYDRKGERKWRGIYGSTLVTDDKQKRNLQQELLRMVGAKVQPIDADIQETYQEWNKKKALQNLLKEQGILNEFNTFYQPK